MKVGGSNCNDLKCCISPNLMFALVMVMDKLLHVFVCCVWSNIWEPIEPNERKRTTKKKGTGYVLYLHCFFVHLRKKMCLMNNKDCLKLVYLSYERIRHMHTVSYHDVSVCRYSYFYMSRYYYLLLVRLCL